jgi:hypothetical protein
MQLKFPIVGYLAGVVTTIIVVTVADLPFIAEFYVAMLVTSVAMAIEVYFWSRPE